MVRNVLPPTSPNIKNLGEWVFLVVGLDDTKVCLLLHMVSLKTRQISSYMQNGPLHVHQSVQARKQ